MIDYFKMKALSKSQLKNWRPDNPMGFWAKTIFNPEFTDELFTDAAIFGKLLHCLLFERDKLKKEFEVCDNLGLTRKNKKWIAAQDESETTLVSTSELEKATKMVDTILKYELYRKLLEGIWAERPYFWYDEEWGVDCKCKVDAIKNTKEGIYVIDYKTTGQLDSLLYSVDKGKFHFDAGFYSRMVRRKYGVRPAKFIFLFQSTKENEEHLIKARSIQEADLDACEISTEIAVKQIVKRLKKWENGDETAWLATPEIERWQTFTAKFDEEVANYGDGS